MPQRGYRFVLVFMVIRLPKCHINNIYLGLACSPYFIIVPPVLSLPHNYGNHHRQTGIRTTTYTTGQTNRKDGYYLPYCFMDNSSGCMAIYGQNNPNAL